MHACICRQKNNKAVQMVTFDIDKACNMRFGILFLFKGFINFFYFLCCTLNFLSAHKSHD